MEEAAAGRVLLAVPGVSLPLSLPPQLLQGQLTVIQGPQDLVLQWEPLERPLEPPGDVDPPDPGFEPDWAVLSPPRPRPDPGWAGGFRLPLGQLRGLRRGPPALSPPFLVLLPRGGGPCPPPLHLPRAGLRKLLRLLRPRLRACPRDPRLLLLATPEDPPEPPPEPGLVSRLWQGGLSRLLGGSREEPPEPEPPFELLTCVTLGPRPRPARGPPLAGADWGRGLSPEVLRERIFRGGLSPEVRARGWRLLLGLSHWGDPEGTPGTPPEPPRALRDDYFRMKLQWRSLSPGQLSRNRVLRGYREQLERDLARAPPSVPRSLLHDVLMTFCMFHFDLGYQRGMLELLPPLLSVVPDEVEAFGAFCSLMELVGGNFGPGLQQQLGALGALVRALSPARGRMLERPRPRRCCRRWLQFRFQRQLGMEGTRRLWEVLWTGLPCPNFHLLVTCALLELLWDSPGDIGDIGDTPGDIGDSPGDIGDTPGDIGDSPGDIGDSPGDSHGDIGDIGDSPGDIGDSDSDGDSDGDTAQGDTDSEDSDEDKVRPLQAGQVLSRAEGIYLQLAAATDLPPALQELLGLGGAPSDGAKLGLEPNWEPKPPSDGAKLGLEPELGAQTSQ